MEQLRSICRAVLVAGFLFSVAAIAFVVALLQVPQIDPVQAKAVTDVNLLAVAATAERFALVATKLGAISCALAAAFFFVAFASIRKIEVGHG